MNNDTSPMGTEPGDNQAPDQTTNAPETPGMQPVVPAAVTAAPWYKRAPVLVILGLAVLVGGGVAAMQLTKDKPTPAANTNQSQNQTKKANDQPTKAAAPYAVVYARAASQNSKPVEGCGPSSKTNLFWRSITGGAETSAGDLGDYNNATALDVHHNHVVIATQASCGGKDGPSIWYSQDSGKSYAKLYTGKPGNDNQLGEQITSVKFGTDGKTIAFAVLPEIGASNQIKELSPDTKVVKDLFASKESGVFIQAYNTEKKQLFFQSGCFNCDGGSVNKLYVFDVDKNDTSVLFEDPKLLVERTVANADASKFLLLESTPATEALGGGEPYTLIELTVASKAAKQLLKLDKPEVPPTIGYRDVDEMPYYTGKNSVFGIDAKGKQSALYTSTKPIVAVHYISKEQAIVATGATEAYTLLAYNYTSKQSTTIFNAEGNTGIFGITWQ